MGLRKVSFEYIEINYMKQVRQKIKPYRPMPLNVLYKNKGGCKDMYTILIREKKKRNYLCNNVMKKRM